MEIEEITKRVTNRLKDQIFITLILLTVVFVIAYFVELPFSVNTVYLTVATFLFAIFASFFTSRQSSRHDSLRESITQFDGNLASIYRGSGNLDKEMQKEIGQLITSHYEALLQSRDWTYHLAHPSQTITSIHMVLDKYLGQRFDIPEFGRTSLMQMQWSLRDLQRVRKDKISLMREQVPPLQWLLLILLATILIATIMSIQSHTAVVASFLKASFVVAVFLVLALIQDLNRLTLFERLIGEDSARDLLRTIKEDNLRG